MTGIADENDRCVFGAYPGQLREVMGVWVEETDALRPGKQPDRVEKASGFPGKLYDCTFLCDLLHGRAAQPLAHYESDFYAGMPCVTEKPFRQGTRLLYRHAAGGCFPC